MGLKTDLEMLKSLATRTNDQKIDLLKSLKKIKLLTPDFANTKTAKSSKVFSGYVSYILHLSPADLAFKFIGQRGTLCPMASQGCKAACLNTAGRGRFNSIQESRIRKSLYFILFKNEFMSHLKKEISRLETKANKAGKRLVIRLNGTSDIQWENINMSQVVVHPILNVFDLFPNVQFYDYTKIVKRLDKVSQHKNYFVVFSASESNESDCVKALELGFNVATVFNSIPDSWLGVKVINGDTHDFRFLDQGRGVIVGLKAKGKAKHDKSGFVKQVCPMSKVA